MVYAYIVLFLNLFLQVVAKHIEQDLMKERALVTPLEDTADNMFCF